MEDRKRSIYFQVLDDVLILLVVEEIPSSDRTPQAQSQSRDCKKNIFMNLPSIFGNYEHLINEIVFTISKRMFKFQKCLYIINVWWFKFMLAQTYLRSSALFDSNSFSFCSILEESPSSSTTSSLFFKQK